MRSRAAWTASGLLLQAAGAGGVAAYLWQRIRHQNAAGHITAAMFRLAWHAEMHTHAGLAVLIAGAALYAIGSILMARPYASHPLTLFVAVPAAAVIGMIVLGLLALVVAVLFSSFGQLLDALPGGSGGPSRKKTRVAEQ